MGVIMLTGSNNKILNNYKKVDTDYLFFYQRWQEMLDSRTLDMYQYNILNSCVACHELFDVIEKTLSGLLTARQNIDDVKAEALEIVQNDDILGKYNKPLHNTLLRILGSKVESKSRGETIEDRSGLFYSSLNRLKYQLLTPIKILKIKYFNYILTELKIDIDNQNYKQIERHMGMLISQCIFVGWSAKGLVRLLDNLEGSANKEDKWKCFSENLLAKPNKKHLVYYSIKIETRQGISSESIREVISSLNLNLKKGNDIIIDNQNNKINSKFDPDSYYIIIDIKSTDLYSAALTAINALNSRLSVASFYNIINPWIANSPNIVVYDVENDIIESFKITDIFKTYDYIDSNNNVFQDKKNILNDNSKDHIMKKLQAAFAYTNLSRSSIFQETKYISLWIAMESLMRTGQYSDIISHIKCVLPEILCIRYLYRIIRNFSEDCIRCGFKHDDKLSINMEISDKKQLVSKLISIFRNGDQYEILKTNCYNRNELLHYRCEEIHIILNNSNIILEKFEHFTKKVRWHIQRLYRIRNEITHSAFQEDRSLIIYIEHLYSYLSQVISEIIYYIEHKNVDSVEEAFSILSDSYHTYITLLKEDQHVPIQDILPDGIIDIIG